jgi:hypothetical protein
MPVPDASSGCQFRVPSKDLKGLFAALAGIGLISLEKAIFTFSSLG